MSDRLDHGLAQVHVLRGALAAFGGSLAGAEVGVVGCSAGAEDFARKLKSHGARPSYLVDDTEAVFRLTKLDLKVWVEEEKLSFLSRPFDVLVIVADAGVITPVAVDTIRANGHFALVVDFAVDSPMTSESAEVHERAGKTWFSPGSLDTAMQDREGEKDNSWAKWLESWSRARIIETRT